MTKGQTGSHGDAPATPGSRARTFAALTGVTVKALQHYERLGLLLPARTPAGHRVYSPRDRERLRQILALKQAGVALTRMRALLDASPASLSAFVRGRREELARDLERLADLDRALALVEEGLPYAPAGRVGLSVLADVTDTSAAAAAMARYFSDDAWEVAKPFYERWPDPQWIALYRDIAAVATATPDRERDADLLRRWNALAMALWRDLTSDLGMSRRLHEGFARAWRDRERWPETLKRRFADYRMEDVARFLRRAQQPAESIADC